MSKEGYTDNGEFFKYPKPLMRWDVDNDSFEQWVAASRHVVESGLFSERLAGYHQHLLDTFYARERRARGR